MMVWAIDSPSPTPTATQQRMRMTQQTSSPRSPTRSATRRSMVTAASPQPKDWLLASCGSPRDGEGRPGPEPAASCRGGLAHWCQSRSCGQASFATWGARPGTQTRPRLRSWPLDRRSGCSSAKPYPPPRPIAIVGAPRLGANHPTRLSRFRLGKPGAAPRCVAAGLVSGACSLGFWPRPSKTVLPLAGITDTGPACRG